MTKPILIFFFMLLGFASLGASAFAADPAIANPQYLFQLSYHDAEETISEALRQKGAGEKIAATIAGRSDMPIFSYGKPLSVELRGLQFDKGARRWNASLLFLSNGEVISAIPATGRFDEMIELPVLKREVRNGDTIGQGDIEVRDFVVTQTRSDTIGDLAALIGKSPVHTISPGRPVREHEIASPAVIKKNGIVQVHYTTPGMEITATGQAMADGAKGDVIEVRNVTSRKVVRAVVADATNVTILAPGIQTSQLTGGNHGTN